MRLPLATPLKSRPNDAAVDARLKNGYVEIKGQDSVVRSRPGNIDLGSLGGAGLAQLLAEWNGLLAVSGDSLLGVSINAAQATTSFTSDSAVFNVFSHGIYVFGSDPFSNDFFISSDGGETFTLLYDTFTEWGIDGWFSNDISDGINIYRTDSNEDVYKSSDNGASWSYQGTQDQVIEHKFFDGSVIYGVTYTLNDVTGDVSLGFYSSSDCVGWVSVGTIQFNLPNTNGIISVDRINFSLGKLGSTFYVFHGIAYEDGDGDYRYVNTCYSSNDGVVWTEASQYVAMNADPTPTSPLWWPNRTVSDTVKIYFGATTAVAPLENVVLSTSDGATFSVEFSGLMAPALGSIELIDVGVFVVSVNGYGGAGSASGNTDFVYFEPSPESASVDSTTAVSPTTADLLMSAESIGAAQSNQQMLIKNSEQGWVYTR